MISNERLQTLAEELGVDRPSLLTLAPTVVSEVANHPDWIRTAAHDTDAHPDQGYDRLDIIEDWQYSVATGSGLFVILDLDENLFDTVGFWIETTNNFLRAEHSIADSNLPTIEQVLAAGGPSNYYPQHFSEIWPAETKDPTNPESYEYFAEIHRHEDEVNVLPPLLPGLVPSELMTTFAQHGQVLGGLTARPATTRVIEATHKQTTNTGFEHSDNPVPIIFRRKKVPLEQSGDEKVAVISEILPERNQAAQVVLFDDSLSTAKVIASHNEKVAGNRKIAYILNAMGPLTAPKMDGALPKDPTLAAQLTEEHGIFVLTSWDSMDDVLTRIEAWHSQNLSS